MSELSVTCVYTCQPYLVEPLFVFRFSDFGPPLFIYFKTECGFACESAVNLPPVLWKFSHLEQKIYCYFVNFQTVMLFLPQNCRLADDAAQRLGACARTPARLSALSAACRCRPLALLHPLHPHAAAAFSSFLVPPTCSNPVLLIHFMVSTRNRKLETPPQLRRTAPAAAAEDASARSRRGASSSQAAPQPSGVVKSQKKSVGSSDSAAVAPKKAGSGARGRPRVSKAPSGPDEDDDSNQGIFPTKKRLPPSPVYNEASGSDSDDAPEEVTKSAALQLHEQAAAAIRVASQPDLAAKRAEKERLRAATQAAQAAASRRKAAEAVALAELPQDVLNAAAAVTLTLQQSLAAPRTNHIPLLPEIVKKPSNRWWPCAVLSAT